MQVDLWGQTALDYSIKQMQTFEPPEGYYLAFSGGKDSIALYGAAKLAGVKFDAHYHTTCCDPPEVIQTMRRHYPDVQRHMPKESMWQLIVRKGMLPTRTARWCCQELKEGGGRGHHRIILTGVRSEESPRRTSRRMIEICRREPTTRFLHALKHWTVADVWDFIHEQQLPYPSIYDEPGASGRVGCVLCPFTRRVEYEMKRWPKIAEAWHRAALRAFDNALENRPKMRYKFATGEDYWRWWLDRDASLPDPDECSMFD